jgi:hypothetical protein
MEELVLQLNGNIIVFQQNAEGNWTCVEIRPDHKDYGQWLSQVKNKKEVKMLRIGRVVLVVSAFIGALIGLGITLASEPSSLDKFNEEWNENHQKYVIVMWTMAAILAVLGLLMGFGQTRQGAPLLIRLRGAAISGVGCGAVGALCVAIPLYGLPVVVHSMYWLDESGRLLISISGVLLGALAGTAVVVIPMGIIFQILVKITGAKKASAK